MSRAARSARSAGSRQLRPAIFLDKDGTLIEDLPYNVDPRRIRLAPGARDGIRLLAAAGHRFVIVTNQSGVARGYFSETDLDEVRDHLAWLVEALGGSLDGFYVCPHLPEGINEYAVECDCRKPLPGLIHRAADELGIDIESSWFIGDTWMDAAAGRAAGCRTIMVGPDARTADELPDDRRPDAAVRDLLGAARVILEADTATGLRGAA
jgi:D-glycero-D-manno-heptose 1,7-bisphosphate phosphatase